jgi:hypothetical protein
MSRSDPIGNAALVGGFGVLALYLIWAKTSPPASASTADTSAPQAYAFGYADGMKYEFPIDSFSTQEALDAYWKGHDAGIAQLFAGMTPQAAGALAGRLQAGHDQGKPLALSPSDIPAAFAAPAASLAFQSAWSSAYTQARASRG